MLTGVWLALAPSAWDYGDLPGAGSARWNDTIVGCCLVVVGYLRLRRPVRLALITALGLLVGTWLMIAPFGLAYGEAIPSALQDIMAGLLVTGVTLAGYLVATDEVQRHRDGGRR